MTGCKSIHNRDTEHQLFTHFPKNLGFIVWAFASSSMQSTQLDHWRQVEIFQPLLYKIIESSMRWETTSSLGARKTVYRFYHTSTCAQHRCWPREVKQLESEAADHLASGVRSCKEQRRTTETRICPNKSWKALLWTKNLQTTPANRLQKVTHTKSWGQKGKKC